MYLTGVNTYGQHGPEREATYSVWTHFLMPGLSRQAFLKEHCPWGSTSKSTLLDGGGGWEHYSDLVSVKRTHLYSPGLTFKLAECTDLHEIAPLPTSQGVSPSPNRTVEFEVSRTQV